MAVVSLPAVTLEMVQAVSALHSEKIGIRYLPIHAFSREGASSPSWNLRIFV